MHVLYVRACVKRKTFERGSPFLIKEIVHEANFVSRLGYSRACPVWLGVVTGREERIQRVACTHSAESDVIFFMN